MVLSRCCFTQFCHPKSTKWDVEVSRVWCDDRQLNTVCCPDHELYYFLLRLLFLNFCLIVQSIKKKSTEHLVSFITFFLYLYTFYGFPVQQRSKSRLYLYFNLNYSNLWHKFPSGLIQYLILWARWIDNESNREREAGYFRPKQNHRIEFLLLV